MTHLARRPRSGFREAPPSASFALPRDVRAPRLARVALRDLLASRGWSQADDADLVLSELVANAVVHGVGQITLTLWLAAGRIHGEVADRGSGIQPPPADRNHGLVGTRGLGIVDALTDRWGVADGASRVWFEFASPR